MNPIENLEQGVPNKEKVDRPPVHTKGQKTSRIREIVETLTDVSSYIDHLSVFITNVEFQLVVTFFLCGEHFP